MSYPVHTAKNYGRGDPRNNPNDTYTQLLISIALGLSAFLIFCFARPRWAELYAGRKRTNAASSALPSLPNSFFGWIPVLYRITQEEVLDSAGLDAYALLSFCRMALKFLALAFLLGITIIYPVHQNFQNQAVFSSIDQGPQEHLLRPRSSHGSQGSQGVVGELKGNSTSPKEPEDEESLRYLWMYVVFVYVFSVALVSLLFQHTRDIIRVRQRYLGSKSTVTDRTIKLSGIPFELRSENKIKQFVEGLEIGRVENVSLCRDWKDLDKLMDKRLDTLRKLETAWAEYIRQGGGDRDLDSLPTVEPNNTNNTNNTSHVEDDESERGRLLHEPNTSASHEHDERLTIRLWYGFLGLRSKKVDAIDYYVEQLRKLDETIERTRKKSFAPTSLAFVTMDSVATCQMAVQAILDASPLVLQAKPAPAANEIVWRNTYTPKANRMARSWIISLFVIVLTVLWALLLSPVAALTSLETISDVLPPLGRAIKKHAVLKSLVQTSLPTFAWSLLNVAVPYLNDWLSNQQGMISQGDVELSVISKNFSFTFFNLFIIYTVIGVALKMWKVFKDSFKDTTNIAILLARNLDGVANFYMNLIILQGIGLFPFRLLDFGSVFLYPFSRFASKTPRDFAELSQPSLFRYGFYLPQTILIFIICVVYSILPVGVVLMFFGLVYFAIGHFAYKYQLLYAMEHPPNATGKVWSIIVSGVLLGLLIFQIAMIGELVVKKAPGRSFFVVPLLPFTLWYGYFYWQNYAPLTKFIALNSIARDTGDSTEPAPEDSAGLQDSKNSAYVNPNLNAPLESPWITGKRADATDSSGG